MKLKLRLDDQHTREVWQAVERAKAQVAAWPDWKRGEPSATKTESTAAISTPPSTKP